MRSGSYTVKNFRVAARAVLVAALGFISRQALNPGPLPPQGGPPPPSAFLPPAHEVPVARQGNNTITGHAIDRTGIVADVPRRLHRPPQLCI
jgi:hypothetical protein